MPWLKVGDNAATHPNVMRAAGVPGADVHTVNETFGFVIRIATLSAAHMTDYVVDAATMQMMGGTNWRHLVKHAQRAGLMKETEVDGAKAWILIDDPELFHIRKKADVQWDRQRERDRKNPDLTMPVLARDGDSCRYCDNVVNWADHKGGRGGTFDHRAPGQPASLATYVVCCRACNRERSNYPDADTRLPLLNPPTHPHYTAKTAERLTAHFGSTFTASPPRPGTQPVTADERSRPGTQPAPATHSEGAQNPGFIRDPRGQDRVGSGRVGSGRIGSAVDPSPATPPRSDPSPPKPKRGHRGRRSRR